MFNTKFIILNEIVIVFNAQIIISNTEFIILNTKFRHLTCFRSLPSSAYFTRLNASSTFYCYENTISLVNNRHSRYKSSVLSSTTPSCQQKIVIFGINSLAFFKKHHFFQYKTVIFGMKSFQFHYYYEHARKSRPGRRNQGSTFQI